MHAPTPETPAPEPEGPTTPEPVPWHDPGPPVRKVSLPPDTPTQPVPVDNPEQPSHEPEREPE